MAINPSEVVVDSAPPTTSMTSPPRAAAPRIDPAEVSVTPIEPAQVKVDTWRDRAARTIAATPGLDKAGQMALMEKEQAADQGPLLTPQYGEQVNENLSGGQRALEYGVAGAKGFSKAGLAPFGLVAPGPINALNTRLDREVYQPNSTGNTIAGGFGSAVPMALTAFATGGAGTAANAAGGATAAAAPAILGAITGAGQTRIDIAGQRAAGQDVSGLQEIAGTIGQGALGAAEGYGQGRLMGSAGRFAQGIQSPLLRAAAAAGVDVAGNAALAVPSHIAGNTVAQIYDPNRPIFAGSGDAALAGAAGGLAFAPSSIHHANAGYAAGVAQHVGETINAGDVRLSPQPPQGRAALAAKYIGDAVGRKVVWFDSDSPVQAFPDADGKTIYANARSPEGALPAILAHEAIGHVARDPAVAAELEGLRQQYPGAQQTAEQEYLHDLEAGGFAGKANALRADPAALREEGTAKFIEEAIKGNPELVDDIAGRYPGLFARIGRSVSETVDRLAGGNKSKARMVREQLGLVGDVFANAEQAGKSMAGRQVAREESQLDRLDPQLTDAAREDQANRSQRDAELADDGRQRLAARDIIHDERQTREENAEVDQRVAAQQHSARQEDLAALEGEEMRQHDRMEADRRAVEMENRHVAAMPAEPPETPQRHYTHDELRGLGDDRLARVAAENGVAFDARSTTVPRILDAQQRRHLEGMSDKELWDTVRGQGLRAGTRKQNIDTLMGVKPAGTAPPTVPERTPEPPATTPPAEATPPAAAEGGAKPRENIPNPIPSENADRVPPAPVSRPESATPQQPVKEFPRPADQQDQPQGDQGDNRAGVVAALEHEKAASSGGSSRATETTSGAEQLTAPKRQYTTLPREWVGRQLNSWRGADIGLPKGKRLPLGNGTTGRYMTQAMLGQLERVPSDSKSLLAELGGMTDEVWPVKGKQGGYTLAPREAVAEATQRLKSRGVDPEREVIDAGRQRDEARQKWRASQADRERKIGGVGDELRREFVTSSGRYERGGQIEAADPKNQTTLAEAIAWGKEQPKDSRGYLLAYLHGKAKGDPAGTTYQWVDPTAFEPGTEIHVGKETLIVDVDPKTGDVMLHDGVTMRLDPEADNRIPSRSVTSPAEPESDALPQSDKTPAAPKFYEPPARPVDESTNMFGGFAPLKNTGTQAKMAYETDPVVVPAKRQEETPTEARARKVNADDPNQGKLLERGEAPAAEGPRTTKEELAASLAKVAQSQGKRYAEKLQQQRPQLLSKNPDEIHEYRSAGYVTRSTDGRYTLHLVADTDSLAQRQNWRIGGTIDVTDQYAPRRPEPAAPAGPAPAAADFHATMRELGRREAELREANADKLAAADRGPKATRFDRSAKALQEIYEADPERMRLFERAKGQNEQARLAEPSSPTVGADVVKSGRTSFDVSDAAGGKLTVEQERPGGKSWRIVRKGMTIGEVSRATRKTLAGGLNRDEATAEAQRMLARDASKPKPPAGESRDMRDLPDDEIPFSIAPAKPGEEERPVKPVLRTAAAAVRQTARDAKRFLSIDPVPKLTAAGIGDQAVEHASAKIATPKIVDDLLSKVLPDSYQDEKATARLADVLLKNRYLGAWDRADKLATEFAAQAHEATPGRSDQLADRAQEMRNRRDAIAQAHNLPNYNADVVAALKDPQTKAAIDRYQEHVSKWLDALYQEVKGAGEEPRFRAPKQGRHFDAYLPIIGELDGPEAARVQGADEFLPPNNSMNAKVRKDRFDRRADYTGTFDTDLHALLSAVVGPRWNEATKLRFYKSLLSSGVAVESGKDIDKPAELQGKSVASLDVKMPRYDPETGQTTHPDRKLFIRSDLVREVRDALDTDQRVPQSPLAKALTTVQLFQLADAVTHAKNIASRVYMSQGAGSRLWDVVKANPAVGIPRTVAKLYGAWREISSDTPGIRAEVAEMAKAGMIRAHFDQAGWLSKIADRTGWDWVKKLSTGDMLHGMDTAARVILNRQYSELVAQGRAEDSTTSRRNFVNTVGQYNHRLMGPLMKAMRDAGISPFVVAGRTYNRNAVDVVTGNARFTAPSKSEQLKARLTQLGMLASIGLTAPLINMITTGTPAGRSGTPLGAIDLGGDDDGGDHKVWDVLQLAGIRRGLRTTGLDAVGQGLLEGKDANTIAGNAFQSAGQAALHPWLGPAVGFGFKALTGRQLDLRGKMEAATIPEGGAKQYLENLRAAIESQNPLVYSLTRPAFQAAGLDQKPQDEESSYLGGIAATAAKSPLGAAGVKDVRPGKDAAEELADRLAKQRFGNASMTPEDAGKFALRQQLTSNLKADPTAGQEAIEQAVEQGKLSEQQAANIHRKAGMSPFAWNVKSLSGEDAAKVYAAATDEQKDQIRDQVVDKLTQSKGLTPAQQDEKLEELGIDPPPDLALRRELHDLATKSRAYGEAKKKVAAGDRGARAALQKNRLSDREQTRLQRLQTISRAVTKAKKEGGASSTSKIRRLVSAA